MEPDVLIGFRQDEPSDYKIRLERTLHVAARRADKARVKAILTVIVYLALLVALAVVSLFTPAPDSAAAENEDF